MQSFELAAWFGFAGRSFLGAMAAELTESAAALREASGANEWSALIGMIDESLSGDPQGLSREHVRLFLNPDGAPCPPWQSANSGEPRLMGASHDSALRWYRSAGVEPRTENEPADHIGLLLIFYSRLLASGATAEQRRQFYLDHLEWGARFCDSVETQAHHPFFQALAQATRRLLALGQPRGQN